MSSSWSADYANPAWDRLGAARGWHADADANANANADADADDYTALLSLQQEQRPRRTYAAPVGLRQEQRPADGWAPPPPPRPRGYPPLQEGETDASVAAAAAAHRAVHPYRVIPARRAALLSLQQEQRPMHRFARERGRETVRAYPVGQGAPQIGGNAACTSISLVAGFRALYNDPGDFDYVRIMRHAASIWRRDSREFQTARNVLSVSPLLSCLVTIAEDGDFNGYADDRDVAATDPAFLFRTIDQALDAFDHARDAFQRMPEEQRVSEEFDGSRLIGNAAAVFTTNDGSTVIIAGRDGAYYELDSHGTAACLYRYRSRAALAASMRADAEYDPATEFTFSILTVPHAGPLRLAAAAASHG